MKTLAPINVNGNASWFRSASQILQNPNRRRIAAMLPNSIAKSNSTTITSMSIDSLTAALMYFGGTIVLNSGSVYEYRFPTTQSSQFLATGDHLRFYAWGTLTNLAGATLKLSENFGQGGGTPGATSRNVVIANATSSPNDSFWEWEILVRFYSILPNDNGGLTPGATAIDYNGSSKFSYSDGGVLKQSFARFAEDGGAYTQIGFAPCFQWGAASASNLWITYSSFIEIL